MSCYTPLIRIEDPGKWLIAEDGHKYHPATIRAWQPGDDNWDILKFYEKNPDATLIPCGKCIGCRLDYSRDWANRGYLESLYSHSYFLTLTYHNGQCHIPKAVTSDNGITYTKDEVEEVCKNEWKGTLVPKDFTNFMKRLRKYLKSKYDIKVRFIGCGEYGDRKRRPHFHFILFLDKPLPLVDPMTDEALWYEPEPGKIEGTYWKNKDIEKCWKKGIVQISDANWSCIAYVARYITKKQFGEKAAEAYAAKGQREKEFFRSSRKPGIGYQYYEDHKEEIYRFDKILIQRGKESSWESPPKYFDNLYKVEFPEDFEIIQAERKHKAMSAERLKDLQTSLTRWQQRQVDKRAKEQCTLALQRQL